MSPASADAARAKLEHMADLIGFPNFVLNSTWLDQGMFYYKYYYLFHMSALFTSLFHFTAVLLKQHGVTFFEHKLLVPVGILEKIQKEKLKNTK